MKEYRIVCRRETFDPDGAHKVQDNVYVVLGTPVPFTTYELEKAEKELARLIKSVEEYEAFTEKLHADGRPHSIIKQTNIRLQSREVTEWENALL